jgi:hypothetical protein
MTNEKTTQSNPSDNYLLLDPGTTAQIVCLWAVAGCCGLTPPGTKILLSKGPHTRLLYKAEELSFILDMHLEQ